MGRKAFLADVESATSTTISRISRFAKGSEDGEIDFCYLLPSGKSINIHLIAQDVSEYPSGSGFMVYTDSEGAPKQVEEALEEVAQISTGTTIAKLLSLIDSRLCAPLSHNSGDLSLMGRRKKTAVDGTGADDERTNEADVEIETDSDEEDDSGYEDDVYDLPYNMDHWQATSADPKPTMVRQLLPEAARLLNRRIRSDLRTVRNAGFRYGVLKGMRAESTTCVLCISARISRLGLSGEAIQAWDLHENQYAVLLIKYTSGYKPFDALMKEDPRLHGVEFCVGVCNKYKPGVFDAINAFVTGIRDELSLSSEEAIPTKASQVDQQSDRLQFGTLFVSASLNSFMNRQLVSLVRLRYQHGVDWDEAKGHLNAREGRLGDVTMHDVGADRDKGFVAGLSSESATSAGLTDSDHLLSKSGDLSFPLIAMQFFLRSLVRCTEFCLVCHDKIEETFEALKPYVCNKPLCLYQYMALGMGPSIEHEILTQPYVVDLLITFCYHAAQSGRIRMHPTGMGLSVPNAVANPVQSSAAGHGPAKSAEPNLFDVKYDPDRKEVLASSEITAKVRRGDWIVLIPSTPEPWIHHRVVDICGVTLYLSSVVLHSAMSSSGVKTGAILESDVAGTSSSTPTPAVTPPLSRLMPVTMAIYNRNFDDLADSEKCQEMVQLIDTLPSIREMSRYLKQQQTPNIRVWGDRISPAALGLLRWIIASNRSSIVQVDFCPGQEGDQGLKSLVRHGERVSNMDGWVQFRFAQGAPDKEQRFRKALENTVAIRNPAYPTLFAWHGSPVHNWHSIIRTGLDFKETIHGRAYGHGCYHSLDHSTSLAYGVSDRRGSARQKAMFKVEQAMCLNEIVNAPKAFTSTTPHLVVQHVDWIQCRYLFVKTESDNNMLSNGNDALTEAMEADKSSQEPTVVVDQDPVYTPRGVHGKPIAIPRCTLAAPEESHEEERGKCASLLGHKRKRAVTKEEPASEDDDDEDKIFIQSDTEELPVVKKGQDKSGTLGKLIPCQSGASTLQFIPGSLVQSTLPILRPPTYASPIATKALNRDLKATLKTQDSTPLHELGWYINKEHIQNIYQWIVELHSFDSVLPLAQDMKAAKVSSIVLEMRFGGNYPMTPPFVRVIRPRFLQFMHGGGGHVTGGGAMCMELLTNSGWSSVSSIDSVLLQVRMAITSLDPKPARLETTYADKQSDYHIGEAMEAYIRACKMHGWAIPEDFRQFGSGWSGEV